MLFYDLTEKACVKTSFPVNDGVYIYNEPAFLLIVLLNFKVNEGRSFGGFKLSGTNYCTKSFLQSSLMSSLKF